MRKYLTLALIAVFAVVLSIPVQTVVAAFTGGAVYDAPRDVQGSIPTKVKSTTDTINSATRIANQVTNLASMSPEAMVAHALGIEEQFKELADTLKALQSSQQALDIMFNQVDSFMDGETSILNNLDDKKKMIHGIDKASYEAFQVAKATSDIDKKAQRISELMSENQQAQGNKDSRQIANELEAELIASGIDKEQILGALTTVITAVAMAENQEMAQATKTVFNTMSLGVSDPYNPTQQDKDNYDRPQGRGFIRF